MSERVFLQLLRMNSFFLYCRKRVLGGPKGNCYLEPSGYELSTKIQVSSENFENYKRTFFLLSYHKRLIEINFELIF